MMCAWYRFGVAFREEWTQTLHHHKQEGLRRKTLILILDVFTEVLLKTGFLAWSQHFFDRRTDREVEWRTARVFAGSETREQVGLSFALWAASLSETDKRLRHRH